MRKKIIFIIKFIGTCFFLYIAFRNVNFNEIFSNYLDWNLTLIFIAFLLNQLNMFLFSFRTSILSSKKFSELLEINYIGTFFNLFLPTSFGGDVARTYYLNKKDNSLVNNSFIIFIDRFMGLTALLLIAIVPLIYSLFTNINVTPIIFIIVGLFFIAIIFAWLIILIPSLYRFISNLIKIISRKFSLPDRNDINNIKPKRILLALLISLSFHLNSTIIVYLFGTAVNIEVNYFYYLIFVPLVNLLLMIPITISGLGIRDFAYASTFSTVTSNPNISLFGVIGFLFVLTNGIIGGILYLLKK